MAIFRYFPSDSLSLSQSDAGSALSLSCKHTQPAGSTVLVLRMAQRKWKETKQEPGTAGTGNMLGCCLISFHFLLVILSSSTVQSWPKKVVLGCVMSPLRQQAESRNLGQTFSATLYCSCESCWRAYVAFSQPPPDYQSSLISQPGTSHFVQQFER